MNQTMNKIEVGRQVYCCLYGGKYGTIVNIEGEPGQVPVQSFGGVLVMGGSADIDVVWDDGSASYKVPEAIVQGVQWKLLDQVVDAETVAGCIANSAIYKSQQNSKAEAEKAAKAIADQNARKEGVAMGLIPEDEFRAAGKRGSAAAYNLRLELKKAGIKASVKQDTYYALRVTVSADDVEAAKAIGAKYKAGSFDGMTDCYEYDTSAWGRTFGDVRYVFTYSDGCLK